MSTIYATDAATRPAREWPGPSAAYLASQAAEGDLATATERTTPADAFDAARRRFVRGERLDMRALAADLGVSRMTLYRWTGQREHLLADVLWSLTEPIVDWALTDAPGAGAQRIAGVAERIVAALVRAPALKMFLEADTDVALRILTSRGGGVQGRMVDAVRGLIEAETGRAGFAPRVEPDVLAYAIVRVTEAFIYNDTILAVEPNVDAIVQVVGLMLD